MVDVLVVEDDDDLRQVVVEALLEVGLKVLALSNLTSEDIRKVRELQPAAILLDIGLPSGNGLSAMVRTLREQRPGIAVVLMSGLPNLTQRPRDVQVDALLAMPFTLHELVDVVMPFCRPSARESSEPLIVQAI
jgi:DNA-binding response OmpR family regulator